MFIRVDFGSDFDRDPRNNHSEEIPPRFPNQNRGENGGQENLPFEQDSVENDNVANFLSPIRRVENRASFFSDEDDGDFHPEEDFESDGDDYFQEDIDLDNFVDGSLAGEVEMNITWGKVRCHLLPILQKKEQNNAYLVSFKIFHLISKYFLLF